MKQTVDGEILTWTIKSLQRGVGCVEGSVERGGARAKLVFNDAFVKHIDGSLFVDGVVLIVTNS